MSGRYLMKLENLLNGLSVIQLAGEVERKDIGKICYDSRSVEKNSIFVAIKGFNVDGHNYVMEAIAKGATVVVLEDDSKISNDYLIHQNVTKILVRDSREALAILSKNFFKEPSKKIKVIGVTGTNGKTSVTYFIKSILDKSGIKTGLIGTITNYIGNEPIPSEKTTPESVELNQLLARMVDEGCEFCIMEVSSHSLELKRVHGIEFTTGVFTNLTQDHLDFHHTMDNYFNSKKKLFDSLSEDAIAITNIDDEYGREIVKDCKAKIYSYGTSDEADFQFINPEFSFGEITFDLIHNNKIYPIHAFLTGTFNLYNLTSAIATCYLFGLPLEKIQELVKNNLNVPGRFELIGNYPVKVIVDYAHTHDALENVLKTIRKIIETNKSKNKIITVFGAGGDRDRTKRPKMGHVVEELSDFGIITSDNPRTENLQQIFNDILSGITHSEKFKIIDNRYEAIHEAIRMAKDGDVVLIAGKGHEAYQIIGTQKIPFDDRKVAKEILEEIFQK